MLAFRGSRLEVDLFRLLLLPLSHPDRLGANLVQFIRIHLLLEASESKILLRRLLDQVQIELEMIQEYALEIRILVADSDRELFLSLLGAHLTELA